ncbi:hypothetical protein [Microvirus mar12]|uniref:Uncharacterized protein n=1 Tax=Microvirus mar12 TaxID=2851144 RepID=A0A8F5RBX5_9VIRU|nr:hypothetical protein [Microvirus mar12]
MSILFRKIKRGTYKRMVRGSFRPRGRTYRRRNGRYRFLYRR